MPETKKLEALTEWLAFDLEDGFTDGGGVLHLRLRHLDLLDVGEVYVQFGARTPKSTAVLALDAVAAWDLTLGGKLVEVTIETKMQHLRPLLSVILKPEPMPEGADKETWRPPVKVLAYEIVKAAEDRKNFLKN